MGFADIVVFRLSWEKCDRGTTFFHEPPRAEPLGSVYLDWNNSQWVARSNWQEVRKHLGCLSGILIQNNINVDLRRIFSQFPARHARQRLERLACNCPKHEGVSQPLVENTRPERDVALRQDVRNDQHRLHRFPAQRKAGRRIGGLSKSDDSPAASPTFAVHWGFRLF